MGWFANSKSPRKYSDSYNKPGCETSTQGYIFDVTMLGWNLSTSTCTATNLFSNPGYLTTGQYAPRSRGQFWMAHSAGATFALLGFKIKNYEGYQGRNPKTGEIINVASKRLPFFKVGKELKDRVDI